MIASSSSPSLFPYFISWLGSSHGFSVLRDSAVIVGVKGMFVDCSIGDALKFGSRRIFGVVIFIWLLLSLVCTLFCLWSSVSNYFGQYVVWLCGLRFSKEFAR